MDKIIMKNLGFYGYHGVLEEEKTIGQKFFIDVELHVDLKKAGEEDDINCTINYAEVYQIIQSVFKSKKYDLIEAIAEEICRKALKTYEKIIEIRVLIKKPEAPVEGIYDYFGVEIRRKRDV